jgi:hypothetical protein
VGEGSEDDMTGVRGGVTKPTEGCVATVVEIDTVAMT